MASKVRIGVIGAGRWGPHLIRNFHYGAGSQLIAVADSNAARLEAIRQRYPNVIVTAEAADIFSRDDIDAVVICTPTVTHYELAKQALSRGKHVFVEKPLGRSVAECDSLISLAMQAGKVLFVGHVFVYNASIQVVRDYIRSGELGQLHHIQVTRTNLGPVRSDVSALWDLGSHDLSILHHWLGEMPIRVSAVGGRFLSTNLEDTVFATYTFSNSLLANLHVSWLNPKKVREITIVGEKKMLVWDDLNLEKPVRIYDKNITIDNAIVDTIVDFRASIHEGETFMPTIPVNEPLAAECQAFLAALSDPSSSLSTGPHGKAVVQALAATDVSIRAQGAPVQISYQ